MTTEEELIDCSKSIVSFKNELNRLAKQHGLGEHIEGLNEAIHKQNVIIDDYDKRVSEALENFSVEEFFGLIKEARQ